MRSAMVTGWLLLADSTDVLEKHPKSTRFVEGYWRRRDQVPAARTFGGGNRIPRCSIPVSRAIALGMRQGQQRRL
jgi:hypothetical protein